MKRVVSLFLPTWPTDRLRRAMGAAAPPLEVPLVLIGRDGRRRVVLAADEAAQRLGLRPGMATTRAHALVAGLRTHGAEPIGTAETIARYMGLLVADLCFTLENRSLGARRLDL